jgi:CubicO group peptidase (beta-lactamase class C family)
LRLFALCFVMFTASALAQPLPAGSPEGGGFSSAGLARIDAFFAREIAADRVPGAVVAIARNGKLVYYKAFGFLDKAAGKPMRLDAIFNLASMTKPMAAVGGLALMETGRLPLKAPLDEFFPEFAHMRVGSATASGDITYEPAQPIYIQDLYRHTSGLVYGARGHTPMHKFYPPSSAGSAINLTGAQFVAQLAAAPLLYQPGTVWDYSLSVDLLGQVIEKVTGERLGAYLKTALWDKVKMPDTGFAIPAEKRERIARPLPRDPITGKAQKVVLLDTPIKFDCAGGCGFGTVGDYLRFGEMLLEGGSLDGERVLSPKTVQLMTSDHLGSAIRNQVAGTEPQRAGYGFGLTVAVRVDDGIAAVPGSKGDYTWNGANGTLWWNDPREHLVVVVGTVAPGPIRKYYREEMADLVYGAMTESYPRR